MTVEEATPVTEVWPDNWLSVHVFDALSTQWRVGMSGAIGLDYNAIPPVLRMSEVPRKQWADLFADLRVMESAALQKMREKK
jgi:hypothetical protein